MVCKSSLGFNINEIGINIIKIENISKIYSVSIGLII